MSTHNSEYKYDVCLSFASEQRPYVSEVADILKLSGISVFYDTYEEADLWGKDLYQHLDAVYRIRGKFCVIFISRAFASKVWTRHELRSAQARALSENYEYILPVRFDETELPGLPSTVAYIDVQNRSASDLAALIGKKLGMPIQSETGSNAVRSKSNSLPYSKKEDSLIIANLRGNLRRVTLRGRKP